MYAIYLYLFLGNMSNYEHNVTKGIPKIEVAVIVPKTSISSYSIRTPYVYVYSQVSSHTTWYFAE